MCLLVKQNRYTEFPVEFLRGVFQRNSDGIGVMWAENGTLYQVKAIVSTTQEFIAFYDEHIKGKDCVWHARYRTHGDICLEQTHPYEVFFDGAEHPILLMHNGVLPTGNDKDMSKSDTWHFINDYLRPLLANCPSIAFEPLLVEMLGKYIGNNRLAMMDHEGNIAVVNEKQGVKYCGAWLSNTYAWDYYGLHPDAKKWQTQQPSLWNTKGGRDWGKPKSLRGVNHGGMTKPITTTMPVGGKTKSVGITDDDIQSFADGVLMASANVFEVVTTQHIRRLFVDVGQVKAWDLLDEWSAGNMSDADFINVMKDPRTLSKAMNRAERAFIEALR